ncbi:MAG: GNAT family N-acetyltransferase [Desulforhopalus sp.]
MNVIATTTRLKFEAVAIADVGLLFELTADQKVMKFFPKVLDYNETEQMVRKIIDHYETYGYCYWKLLSKAKNEFIGIAGLLNQEIDGIAETEISYRIKPEYWDSGYATEAAHACKEYAEKALGKKRLISIIHPQNTASKCVAQKLGAYKSKSIVFMGEEHEVYVY